MIPFISVVIPTHNPRMDYLARVIDALQQQTLPRDQWEVVVVDNGSEQPLAAVASGKVGMCESGKTDGSSQAVAERPRDEETKEPQVSASLPSHLPTFPPSTTHLDLSWHPNARVVREDKLGLTFARLRGFAEAKGELIVMVDDDNVLAPDYLKTAVRIAEKHPMLGAFGGKCLPEFEVEPPEWLKGITSGLGLRDLGEEPVVYPFEGEKVEKCESGGGGLRDERLKDEKTAEDGRLTAESANRNIVEIAGGKQVARRPTDTEDGKLRLTEFPDCAPIGAGMVLRRDAAAAYAERIEQQTKRLKDQETITDRKGDSLASGGDNDICLTVIEEGWQVGYLPQLKLAHLIPARRMTLDYHKRMARDSMKSFILMLDQHGIRPWPAMAKWTLPLRVASDCWRVKPWQGAEQSLRFWGHIGMYEGRAAMPAQPTAAGVDG